MTTKNINVRPARPAKVAPAIALIDAWSQALIALGRFPAGTRKTETSPFELVKLLARAERASIMELRETFTLERSQISKRLLSNKKQLVGYLLGFHLANAARLELTLGRVRGTWKIDGLLRQASAISISDIGCGAGAMAQSWLAYLQGCKVDTSKIAVQLFDSNQILLNTAKDIITYMDAAPELHSVKCAIEDLRLELPNDDTLAIYSIGYVWNELTKNQKGQRNLQKFFTGLAKQAGKSIISLVEPASQHQSRATMELRNDLVAAGFVPLYPCPHAEPCPMLERSRDWCYSEFKWTRPRIQEQIDLLTEADRLMLAASAFVFASPAAAAAMASEGERKPIVVGRPVRKTYAKVKREFDYLLCNKDAVLTKDEADPTKIPLRRGEKFNKVDYVKNREEH